MTIDGLQLPVCFRITSGSEIDARASLTPAPLASFLPWVLVIVLVLTFAPRCPSFVSGVVSKHPRMPLILQVVINGVLKLAELYCVTQ